MTAPTTMVVDQFGVATDASGNGVANGAVVPAQSYAAVTCEVDLTVIPPQPMIGRAGRVSVETFGEPQSMPSAWTLPPEARVWVQNPGGTDSLFKLAAIDPECVAENDEVITRSASTHTGRSLE